MADGDLKIHSCSTNCALAIQDDSIDAETADLQLGKTAR